MSSLDQYSTGSVSERRVAEMIGLIGVATAAFSVTALNQTQIKALATTPVQLVAAVPGKIIWPLSGRLLYSYSTRSYTVPNGASLYAGDPASYGTPANAWGSFGLQSLSSTANANEGLVLKTGSIPTDLNIGKSLVLYADGASPTNGQGSIVVYVVYRVL